MSCLSIGSHNSDKKLSFEVKVFNFEKNVATIKLQKFKLLSIKHIFVVIIKSKIKKIKNNSSISFSDNRIILKNTKLWKKQIKHQGLTTFGHTMFNFSGRSAQK